MKCKKCGNEILDGEKFCGKCGTKVELNIERETNNIKEKKNIKIKPIYLIIVIVIIVAVSLSAIMKNNKDSSSISNIFSFNNQISNEKLTKMLKNSNNGIYLQENSVKVGSSIDFNYNNYNKLVSYSCIYMNGTVTLNSGGLLMLNEDTEDFKILQLSTDFMSIIYYLNTEEENDKLNSITILMGEYINANGIDKFSINDNNIEEYMTLGKDIGEIVGVELCRDIIRDALIKINSSESTQSVMASTKFFYKRNEISPRYLGYYTTKQVYNWPIDETAARLLYSSNRQTYNNMVAIYGQPYKTVETFTVYDFTKEDTPVVGSYDNEKAAENKLGIEQ